MGLLALGIGKTQESLPFFETALEVNPKQVQFWLSYINALIKLDRLADAKEVVTKASTETSVVIDFWVDSRGSGFMLGRKLSVR